jgi:hypothetical protein
LVRFPPWPGIFFKPARCGYTLRVTSQATYIFIAYFKTKAQVMYRFSTNNIFKLIFSVLLLCIQVNMMFVMLLLVYIP